jgi:hypothetical protein
MRCWEMGVSFRLEEVSRILRRVSGILSEV